MSHPVAFLFPDGMLYVILQHGFGAASLLCPLAPLGLEPCPCFAHLLLSAGCEG